jgi:hypothetical protein
LATFTEERWENYLRNFPAEASLAEVEHNYEVNQRAREAAH